jgi:3-hydroxyacyl-CoA dehydrogenase/enoyl-CoA hydratase/3-hydroxybutyryl-CoA epimerase
MTDSANSNGAVKYEKGDDGIVVLTLDDPTSSANTMNDLYKESMGNAIDRLYAEKDDPEGGIAGVVITSAKKTFFAGGNLKAMLQAGPDDAQAIFEAGEGIKADLRRLEKLGKPVAAAINGAALGGGLEIALACHHRIVVDDNKVDLGLPEVTLGLLPGGGGVTRTVRMLGIQSALMDVLRASSPRRPRRRGSSTS